jgi:hypothetical protein
VKPGLGSPPARRSDASWWATSLVALCCAIVLLAIGFGLVILVSFGTDTCPVAGTTNSCPVSDDYVAGWRIAALAVPVGLVSLLIPHRVRWLWLRIPILLVAVALCAGPIVGFMIGVGNK